MKRYVIEAKILSNTTGDILTVQHSLVYESLDGAAESIRESILSDKHVYVGFRTIELQEVDNDY